MTDVTLHPRFEIGSLLTLRRNLSRCVTDTRNLALQQLQIVQATLEGLETLGVIPPQPQLLEQLKELHKAVELLDDGIFSHEGVQETSRHLDSVSHELKNLLEIINRDIE